VIAKAKPNVVGARDYIGNSDGPAAGKRAGTEEWVRQAIKYSNGALWNNGTYGQIEYRRKTYLAHRASYMVYKGEIPSGQCVCHSCDVPLCINPDHLWAGSHKENTHDMFRKNRARFNPSTKVNSDMILEILNKIKSGEMQKTVAAEFGVSQSYVSLLTRGLRRHALTADKASA